uniref:Uncharacterized protein n=1 Tax=Arundo donax TaxID=35708 RepID=A0A0A9BFE4_ARUDO
MHIFFSPKLSFLSAGFYVPELLYNK